MEAKTVEALRRSIRQPGVGFRENMLQALESAGVLTLCDALDGLDTITRITGIGKRAKSIVEAWAGRMARELGMTLNELKVEAEKMRRDESDTTDENRPLVRVTAVPPDLRDIPLRFELPEHEASKGQTTYVRNTLRKYAPSADSEGRSVPFNEVQVLLGNVESILRSPSASHKHLRPLGANWKLAKACLENTLRQYGYELVWIGVIAHEAKVDPPKLMAQIPADVPTPMTTKASKHKLIDRSGTGRSRSRGVMGDIERHLREVGCPRNLDEMADIIRQSVLTRLREGKDVFVETADRWGLKDWNGSHDCGKTISGDPVAHLPADVAGAKLRERYRWMQEGIITEADYESYKKRVLEA